MNFKTSLFSALPLFLMIPLAQSTPTKMLITRKPFFEGTPAQLLGTYQQPFDFTFPIAEVLYISVNGKPPIKITFPDSVFALPSAATAAEIAAKINADSLLLGETDLVATSSNGKLQLSTKQLGNLTFLKVYDGEGTPAALLGLSYNGVTGTQFPATESTKLNDLVDNVVDYAPGDTIFIGGADHNGNLVGASLFFLTPNGTMGHLIEGINFAFLHGGSSSIGPTASLDSSGRIVIVDNVSGRSLLKCAVYDDSSNVGSTSWAMHPFQAKIIP